MQFPYGIADFQSIIENGLFYVDRTHLIPAVEQAGRQLIFLRPRRFGKSLWLSTLENYYDIAKAEKFDRLFGHLAIGSNPTPLRNSYVIMRWDFSLVAATGSAETIERRLHTHVNESIDGVWKKYRYFLKEDPCIYAEDCFASLTALVRAVQRAGLKLYLLIDEYDNFANELMMGSDAEHYGTLLHGEGAVRALFKAVKAATAGMGLERVFITGVSPVAMSDITSAYNVASNIYLLPQFNRLCGFTEEEIGAVLEPVIAAQPASSGYTVESVLGLMRAFYNGYRFAKQDDVHMYNPTLALYFLRYFSDQGSFPEQMLDGNLAMDHNKIHYIARMSNGTEVIGRALDASHPIEIPLIAERLGVRQLGEVQQDSTGLISLLYYMGALTHTHGALPGRVRLKVPNLVMRKLYVEEVRALCLPDLSSEADDAAIRAVYMEGEIAPLCRLLENGVFRALSNRDYRWSNELTVKVAFLAAQFNDILFIMDSEPELNRGYADLSMIVRPDMRHYGIFDLLMEFKFVALKDVGLDGEAVRRADDADLLALPAVVSAMNEAGAQLQCYAPVMRQRYGEDIKLRCFAVVAVGFDRLVWQRVEA